MELARRFQPWPVAVRTGRFQRHSAGRIRGDSVGEADRGRRLHHRRPRPSRYGQKELARLITVCYAGTGQTGCGWGRFNTPAGTWSNHTAVMPYIDYTPSPRGADLARQIARGQWRIAGHTRLRGQRAIKLAQTRSGTFQGHPVFLWVSTATYLALRMIW